MIGFWWGNGAEGMDILTACEVLEVKRKGEEVLCLLEKFIDVYNCAYWGIKKS